MTPNLQQKEHGRNACAVRPALNCLQIMCGNGFTSTLFDFLFARYPYTICKLLFLLSCGGDDDIRTGQRDPQGAFFLLPLSHKRMKGRSCIIFSSVLPLSLPLDTLWSDIMSVSLTSTMYTLAYICLKSSLFWLLYKHNYIFVITSFHAAQDLFWSVGPCSLGSRLTHKGEFQAVILGHKR